MRNCWTACSTLMPRSRCQSHDLLGVEEGDAGAGLREVPGALVEHVEQADGHQLPPPVEPVAGDEQGAAGPVGGFGRLGGLGRLGGSSGPRRRLAVPATGRRSASRARRLEAASRHLQCRRSLRPPNRPTCVVLGESLAASGRAVWQSTGRAGVSAGARAPPRRAAVVDDPDPGAVVAGEVRARSSTSSAVPATATRPWSSSASRWAYWPASVRSCIVDTTVSALATRSRSTSSRTSCWWPTSRARRRLVEQQDRARPGPAPGRSRPAGARRRTGCRAARSAKPSEVELLERLRRPPRGRPRPSAASGPQVRRAAEQHVVGHRQAGRHDRRLRDQRRRAGPARGGAARPIGRPPISTRPSAADEPGEHPQERRLAAPVRPDDAHPVAGLDAAGRGGRARRARRGGR